MCENEQKRKQKEIRKEGKSLPDAPGRRPTWPSPRAPSVVFFPLTPKQLCGGQSTPTPRTRGEALLGHLLLSLLATQMPENPAFLSPTVRTFCSSLSLQSRAT